MVNENNEVNIALPAVPDFSYEGRPVRYVLDEKGEPWFVAKDIVEGIGNTWHRSVTIAHVPEEWRGANRISSVELLTLSEQGVNFYLIRSDNPKALPLQKKIAGEILPSIRRTGKYEITPSIDLLCDEIERHFPGFKVPRTLSSALKMIGDKIEENDQLKQDITRMKPKEEKYDEFIGTTICYSGLEAVRLLNFRDMGRNTLYDMLRCYGIFMPNNLPYQRFIENGWFICKVDVPHPIPLFTAKGLDGLRDFFLNKGFTFADAKQEDLSYGSIRR